eukprot:GHVH01002522.1.p1 GENE.GHVH01002522.1~~GHVH01002522.1.p1  ORF type:complete len:710 (-),score=103.06 GHVH01002522.1:3016-4926(-)
MNVVQSYDLTRYPLNHPACIPWHIWGRKTLLAFLSKLMLRRTIVGVKDEIDLSPMVVYDVEVDLSPAETALYSWMVEDIMKSHLPFYIFNRLVAEGLFLYGNWSGALEFFSKLTSCLSKEDSFNVCPDREVGQSSSTLSECIEYFVNRQAEWLQLSFELLGLRKYFVRPRTGSERMKGMPVLTAQDSDQDLPSLLKGMRQQAKKLAERGLREVSTCRCVLARLLTLETRIQESIRVYESILYSSGAIRRALRHLKDCVSSVENSVLMGLCGWSEHSKHEDEKLRIDPTTVIHICGALVQLMSTHPSASYQYSRDHLLLLATAAESDLVIPAVFDMTRVSSKLISEYRAYFRFYNCQEPIPIDEEDSTDAMQFILSPDVLKTHWLTPPTPLIIAKGSQKQPPVIQCVESHITSQIDAIVFDDPHRLESWSKQNTTPIKDDAVVSKFWKTVGELMSEMNVGSDPVDSLGYFNAPNVTKTSFNLLIGFKMVKYADCRNELLACLDRLPSVTIARNLLTESVNKLTDDQFDTIVDRIENCHFCYHSGDSSLDNDMVDRSERLRNRFKISDSGVNFKDTRVPLNALCDVCQFGYHLHSVLRFHVKYYDLQIDIVNLHPCPLSKLVLIIHRLLCSHISAPTW